jgi:hypothetical protein
VDLRCSPYSTNGGPASFCENEQYKHYFQCDARPGDACAEAPQPSADPNQDSWCCEFPCTRAESSDHRCPDGLRSFACDSDDPGIPAELGCEDSVDSFLICCS